METKRRCWWNRQQQKRLEDFSVKNGGLILEELLTSFNGESLPMRVYSLKELSEATNGFDQSRLIERDVSWWYMYRGTHGGRTLSVKLFDISDSICDAVVNGLRMIIQEVAIASQMGRHSNFLKLVGYCIESELPILVYEDFNGGLLSRYVYADEHDKRRLGKALPFETRLKIANDIADAVSFLHHGTRRTVIHSHVNPSSFFLDDESSTVKLGNFIHSHLIPLGEDHVTDNAESRVFEFVAPEVLIQGRYTQKSDVYSFGATLLDVFYGKKVYHKARYQRFRLVNRDPDNLGFIARIIKISEGEIPRDANQQQLEDCEKLIDKCLSINPEQWPTMIEASQAIRKIRRLPA